MAASPSTRSLNSMTLQDHVCLPAVTTGYSAATRVSGSPSGRMVCPSDTMVKRTGSRVTLGSVLHPHLGEIGFCQLADIGTVFAVMRAARVRGRCRHG